MAQPGGGDPDNRRDFPGGWSGDLRNAFLATGRSAAEEGVLSHLQALTRLRATRPGFRGNRTEHLFSSEQAFVYRRGESVVVLNNDTTAVTVEVPGPLAPSSVIGGCSAPVRKGTAFAISIPPRTGCVF